MTRILFVDDEVMVLKGLRRMLHSCQDRWEMSFADSGEHALEAMESESFDVIVSDIRMPGMNGTQLLAEVQKRFPSTVRVILSGHADEDLILESTRYAHQYLSKPCEENDLRSTIERCCEVHSLLDNAPLLRIVSSLETIPSLPALYSEILALLGSETWSLDDIAAVVAKDVGMTAKMLQLVNSSFFGLKRSINTTKDAVAYLGVGTIKALVLSVEMFSQFNEDTIKGLDVEEIAQHNMNTGSLAQQIADAENVSGEVVDHAFLAGALHDAGRLILAANLPGEYVEVLKLINQDGLEVSEAERQVLGATHAQVAAYLMSLWALPQPIVDAVAHHHDPSQASTNSFTPVTAVHVASALLTRSKAKPVSESREDEMLLIDHSYIELIGMQDRLPTWLDIFHSAVESETQ